MSRYGIDFYGSGVSYGTGSSTVYVADGFVAKSVDYGAIKLEWGTPKGTLDESLFRLVRNQYGFPETADDGVVLVETATATSPNSFLNVGLTQGKYQYYSIFVTDESSRWVKAGEAYALSVKDWGFDKALYDTLPTPYKAVDLWNWRAGGVNQDLVNFLGLFAFQLSIYRTEIDIESKPYDPNTVSIKVLPILLRQLGMTYETGISAARSRALAWNATRLHKMRGTPAGLKLYAESLTGFPVAIEPGKNLSLTINDSSFEESAGSWEPIQKCIIERVPGNDTLPAFVDSGSPAGFPNKSKGMLAITTNAQAIAPTLNGGVLPEPGMSYTPSTISTRTIRTSGGTWASEDYAWATEDISWTGGGVILPISHAVIGLAGWPIDPYQAIPVEPNLEYSASIRMTSLSSSRSAVLCLSWFNESGNLLKSISGEEVSLASGWSEVFVDGEMSPNDAAWATVRVQIRYPAENEVFYADGFQFEKGSVHTFYEDSRQTNIVLTPTLQNIIKNPTFDLSIGAWKNPLTGTTSGLTLDTSTFVQSTLSSLMMTETTAGTVGASYSGKIAGGTGVNLSLYYKGDATVTLLEIAWSTGDKTTVTLPSSTSWARGYLCSVSPPVPKAILAIRTSDEITMTTDIPHGYSAGDEVTISGCGYPFDGKFVIASAPTTYTFTYTRVGTDIVYTDVLGTVEGYRDFTVTVTMTGATGLVGNIDGVMLEPLGKMFETLPATSIDYPPKEFFDGSSRMGDPQDTFWLGDPHDSISVYYANRVTKYHRLRMTAPEYLPAGGSFKLSFASGASI